MAEPKTHPQKPTLSRDEASEQAKALVLELRDVLSNEEAWFIAQAHLGRAFEAGFKASLRQEKLDLGLEHAQSDHPGERLVKPRALRSLNDGEYL